MEERVKLKKAAALLMGYENNGTDAQVWQISHDADHYVIIRSKNSGKALSVQDNSAQN